MFKNFSTHKVVEHHGHEFGVLILPILSISKPSRDSRHNVVTQRMVFDWGKSLSHPNAKVAFGMLTRPGGHYFQHMVMGDNNYVVMEVTKCRSGRLAAIVCKDGPASLFDSQLVQKVLAQEFPSK
jgi:hypothetical protein